MRYALPQSTGRRLLVLAIAAVSLTVSALITERAIAQTSNPIRVGVVIPLTGPAARFGSFASRGTILAAKEINDTGGLLGRKIELVQADEQCVPAEGVSAVQRLLNLEKVTFILGPVCSSTAKAVQPIVEAAKIPMVLGATSDPEITYKAGVGGYRWTFRNYPTEEIRLLIILEHAYKAGHRKFATVLFDNDSGRSILNLLQKYKSRFPGFEHTSNDLFSLKETDFRPILAKIRSGGAEVILFSATAGDTIQILGRQMRELGMVGKIKIMGYGDLTHSDNLKALGPVLEGAVEATNWLPQWDHPRSKKFVADYQAMFGGESPNSLAYGAWETMHLTAQAIKEAKSADAEAINKALEAISYDSAMGKVKFDDHHQANVPMLLLGVKDGKAEQLGAFYTAPDYPK